MGGERARARGLGVGDGGVDAERQRAVGVGGRAEGQIGQGEDGSALHHVGPVEVLLADGHGGGGPAVADLRDLDA